MSEKRTGIVPRDHNETPLKKGDAYYHGGRKVGTVSAVLSSSYCIDFEDDVKLVYASREETAEAVDKGII